MRLYGRISGALQLLGEAQLLRQTRLKRHRSGAAAHTALAQRQKRSWQAGLPQFAAAEAAPSVHNDKLAIIAMLIRRDGPASADAHAQAAALAPSNTA